MKLIDWIYSSYPNPAEKNQWGILHVSVLLLCIATIVALALLFRKKEKQKKYVVFTLVAIIFIFEIARRVINITRPAVFGGEVGDWRSWAYILIPRPWCAISCWLLIASVLVNKKFFYNLASMSALICAIIFFAYPEAGFNNKYFLFENVYSITTHALLLITSITLITLNFAEFKYIRGEKWKDTALLELIGIVGIFLYATIEILLKIEGDPLYFMPGCDVMEILGLNYPLYIVLYSAFLILYFNLFYLIPILVTKMKNKKLK